MFSMNFVATAPSLKSSRYEILADQTFSTLTNFIENMCSICISK